MGAPHTSPSIIDLPPSLITLPTQKKSAAGFFPAAPCIRVEKRANYFWMSRNSPWSENWVKRSLPWLFLTRPTLSPLADSSFSGFTLPSLRPTTILPPFQARPSLAWPATSQFQAGGQELL